MSNVLNLLRQKIALLQFLFSERILNLLGVGIAIVALLFSWQANRNSEEANAIAKKQSEIALLAVSANIYAAEGYKTDIVHIYTCKYNDDNPDYSYMITQNTLTFVNNGGLATSLIEVNLLAGSFDWNISLYERNARLELPITIEPGTARVWTLVAKTRHSREEDRVWQVDDNGKRTLNWNFKFSNGKVVVWTTYLFPDMGFSNHSDCEHFDALELLYVD